MKLQRLLCAVALAAALPMAAHAAVSISVNIAPPPLPVYVQPPIPSEGYLWTPGYWRWDPIAADYFWVPGTWVAPPAVGLLWTPGYWGWGGGGYFWHGGYWGPRVGFYGGVNYGYGYVGSGYHGGYWRGGIFNYNRSVNNIDPRFARNVYNTPVMENHTRTSFNGGHGGLMAQPGREERLANAEHHFAPTQMQQRHEQVAMRAPEQRASVNHGAPALAAMPRPADGRGAEATHGRPGQDRPGGNVPAPPRHELARGGATPAGAAHDQRGADAGGQRGPGMPAQAHQQPQVQAHPQQGMQPHQPPQMQAHQPPQAQVHPQPQMQAPQQAPVQAHPQPQGQPPHRAQPDNEHRGGKGGERER